MHEATVRLVRCDIMGETITAHEPIPRLCDLEKVIGGRNLVILHDPRNGAFWKLEAVDSRVYQ